jgi:hypothetical protein
MKTHEVYVKFESDGEEYYFSIDELLLVGNPIDEDGIEMDQGDDGNLYVTDGENGYKLLSK